MTVLDAGCGSGFGATMLARSDAKAVIGLDLDLAANKKVWLSHGSYPKSPLYLVGNAEKIPLPDLAVDVVVCIETLEHVNQDQQAVAEFCRILKTGGTLYLTTPNAKITQPKKGKPDNPFHIREYTPHELQDLLSARFSKVVLLGQRVKGNTDPLNHKSSMEKTISYRKLINSFPLKFRRDLPKFLPPGLADKLVRQVTGHNFHLREEDITFEDWGIDESPVLIAICTK
jgi:ubiquinone/menaquinone biosynthesis C-methylase UbiE